MPLFADVRNAVVDSKTFAIKLLVMLKSPVHLFSLAILCYLDFTVLKLATRHSSWRRSAWTKGAKLTSFLQIQHVVVYTSLSVQWVPYGDCQHDEPIERNHTCRHIKKRQRHKNLPGNQTAT